MPRFERKNKSYRCSSLVVRKMYPCIGERSGSKSMMVLLKRNCPHSIHCIGLWLFPAEDVVRAGDCRLPWEPELVSPLTRLVRDWCLLFVVWGLVCLVLIVPYLSFWSRCLTMTILAQLNDCHCCNDAAQLSSKKNVKLPFTSSCHSRQAASLSDLLFVI